jgi:hypothetical protein
MKIRKITPKIFSAALSLFAWGGLGFLAHPVFGGTLSFSKPEKLATLPWSNGSNHGVSPKGPEWLVVDNQGNFILESDQDFDFYAPRGKYQKTIDPMDKSRNFYGFTAMESLADGSILLLVRSESTLEQWGKDNFEEHTKPGARLMVLNPDGQVRLDKEEVDQAQPHSNYYAESGVLYSIHEDGTYQVLDSIDPRLKEDRNFGQFAVIAYSLERWRDHLKNLPVFQTGNRIYHDTKGQIHEIKGATSTLLGHTLVEGVGPLAERDGKIYFQVVCDKNQDFVNAVFVEDVKKKDYGLVDLFHSDEELDMAHGHTVFVDSKGNVFEGVGKKDGYRIYEWKRLN